MTGNRLAKRYAKALALTLSDAREYRRLSGELAAVSQLLATNRQLQMALETPLISAAQKKEIVALIQENFPGSPKTHRFLQILAEENRLLLLPAILTELEGVWYAARGIEKIGVTSAVPLTSRQSQQLQRQLEKAFATQVVLQAGVEPALLAGLRLQRGSVVYDFSLRANLQRLRERLLEES